METLITAKTSPLCFNKDDFMMNFSVDKFVSDYRKFVCLETVLEDLGLYHKILCSAMVELINKDYGDFVNLSSYLVGLDKTIKYLLVPLEKLKVDVTDIMNNLDETLEMANSQFSNYTIAYKKKVMAYHVLCALEGLKKIEDLNLTGDKIMPSDVFERMAMNFNIVQFHMNKMSIFKKIKSKQVLVEEVSKHLICCLEKLFLQSLSSNDSHLLTKILHIYAVIDKQAELEKFYSDNVVGPYMKQHISEANILKLGLSKVYDNVSDFVTSPACTSILDATRKVKRRSVELSPVSGYDILVNAVFPQILHCFELVALVHVYAPGDPELFHENYTSTILFLNHFEQCCHVQTSVKRLRKHEAYRQFLGKFNLDVYFQIRFQEIAGKLEESLSHSEAFSYTMDEENDKSKGYLLNASHSLTKCVEVCWDDRIFLDPLSHNFFSLTLQLISRFYRAASLYLKCHGKKSVFSVDAVAIMRDVEALIVEFRNLFKSRISLKISRNIVEGAFEESIVLLQGIIPLAHELLIKSLTAECCNHLKLITDIPRLYRKTNREVPSKASNYVSLVFNNLNEFLDQTDSILSSHYKQICLQEVTNGIIIQCLIMIKDVLTAIKKMEDSLKILKRVREKGALQTSSSSYSTGAVTDDDKIRHQLVIDINAIEDKVCSLIGVEACESMKSFKELKGLMNSSEEKENSQNYV